MQNIVFQFGGGVIIKDMVKADGGGGVIVSERSHETNEKVNSDIEVSSIFIISILVILALFCWLKLKGKK